MSEIVDQYFHARRALREWLRCVRCIALAQPGVEPADVARNLYPDLRTRALELVQRAAVDPHHGGSGGPGSELSSEQRISSAFADAVTPLTVLGRLQGWLPVPFLTGFPFISATGAFDFAAERTPIPVTSMTTGGPVSLPRTHISGIVAVSGELLQHGAMAEQVLFRAMRDGVVAASDRNLLDPAVTEVARHRPASLTNGLTPVNASGAVDAASIDAVISDLLQVLIVAGSTLQTVTLVTDSQSALALAFMRNTDGSRAYPEVTVTGGRIAGLPLLVSDSAPTSQLTAIDASELLVADDGEAEVTKSTSASIEMDDAPAGGAAAHVSMFATDSAALRISRFISWRMRQTGFVSYASSFNPPLPGESV